MSDNLIEFLRARLDEDAALAEAASPGPWRLNAESDEVLAVDGITVAEGFALSGRQLRATTGHIARHDPTRVLTEVEAKRGIIDWYATRIGLAQGDDGDDYENVTGGTLEYVLRGLGIVYTGHPDYRPEWRP